MKEIVQYTIRFPNEVLEEIKKESNEIGSSLNSYILVLIDLGRKSFNLNQKDRCSE